MLELEFEVGLTHKNDWGHDTRDFMHEHIRFAVQVLSCRAVSMTLLSNPYL